MHFDEEFTEGIQQRIAAILEKFSQASSTAFNFES